MNQSDINKLTTKNAYLSDLKISKILESDYNKKAIEFLKSCETTCRIDKIGVDFSSWNKKDKVNKYSVTLKNKKHEYTFDVFDSIYNTEKNISLEYNFYSVLTCLNFFAPDSFDDFCLEFGYEFKNESDYIKTKTIHLACLDQNKNLRKLFNEDQLNSLSEIV